MQTEALVYPMFIKEAKGIIFCCIPDFDLNFRAKSIPASIKNARKLIDAEMMISDVDKQPYPVPSDVEAARNKAKEISHLDYCDAPVFLIDVDFILYDEKRRNRPVIRECEMPYWMDKRIDELGIECSPLLEDAVKSHLHKLSRLNAVAELVGKDVCINTFRGEYYGRIACLLKKDVDDVQYDTLKLDMGNGIHKRIILDTIENVEPCDIVFDITGIYHADYSGGAISYKGDINWCGDTADVYLDYLPAGGDSLDKALSALHKLYEDLYGWDKKLKSYAAKMIAMGEDKILLTSSYDKLTEIKYISKDEFKRRMKLSFINVSPNGDCHFDFSFDGYVTKQVIEMNANVYTRKVFGYRFRPNTDR